MTDIDTLMKKTGLSIIEMCDLANVDRDTLYKWRKNKQQPSNSAVQFFKIIEWVYDNGLLDKLKNDIRNLN